jgi:hypothetical protein
MAWMVLGEEMGRVRGRFETEFGLGFSFGDGCWVRVRLVRTSLKG